MTPETTILVRRLRGIALDLSGLASLRAAQDRAAEADGIEHHRRTVLQAADLLSQERTCSTCRHGKVRPMAGYDPIVCFAEWSGRPGRAAPTFDRRVTADYGCLLWEQADPKERA
jgi:hypothetical protein